MRTLLLGINKTYIKELNELGIKTDVVETWEDFIYYFDIRNYDLIVIEKWTEDIKQNGIENIINDNKSKKVLIISKDVIEGKESEELHFLEEGVDDYIELPKSNEVIIKRSLNLLDVKNPTIKYRNFRFETNEGTIFYNDKRIQLNGKPYEVFLYLAQHPNQIVTKEQLLYAIWEEPELVTPSIIDVSIMDIRRNVDKVFDITTVETIRRRGYRF